MLASFENFLTQNLWAAEQAVINAAPTDTDSTHLQRLQNTFVATLRQTLSCALSLQDEAGRIVAGFQPCQHRYPGSNTKTTCQLADPTKEILRIGQPWIGRDFSNGDVATPEKPGRADAQSFIPVTRSMPLVGRRSRCPDRRSTPTTSSAISPTAVDNDTGLTDVLRYDGTVLMGTSLDVRVGSSN